MNANREKLSECVIGCAFAVSNVLGAGFLEAVYQNALAIGLRHENMVFEAQKPLDVTYRGCIAGHYIADFVVDNRLVLEVKALSSLSPQHEAQLMNYLRATGLAVGLLLNFGTPRVGGRRIVVQHDDDHSV